MTLKAHWKATKVSYTVIHWWENADDDEYSFHESENKTGLTGTEANAKAKSYDGFTAQPVTKKTIKGDGSTIVSVYYKRNVYYVKFYSYSTPGFLWNPGKPSEEYVDLRITAKYGQDISKKWPTYKGSSTWSTTDDSGPYQVNIGTMPLGGAKFYGPLIKQGSESAYYYVEVLPGEAADQTVSGIKYKLDHTDTTPGTGYSITEEDQYPLKGFTFNGEVSDKIGKRYDGASFYYTRNDYNLNFINNGKQEKTVSKKYEQSISSENYTPARPSSLPEYYVFDGWYENELCEGEAFNFTGQKMPAQNVTLYAKWTAKKINLTYNLNNPEGTVDKDTKKVEAGTIASTVLPSIPTINEYSFAGWYYADGNGNITSEAFHTGSTITRDTSIVGKWLYKGELRVVYNPGTEKDATVPTDDRVYAGGARVTVAGNATTTSGKKFLGWELNGNVYKPGQSFEVNKDIANKDNQIILTATWGNAETSTTLTYDPGNGIGKVKTVNVMNNEAVKIKAHNSLGFTAPVEAGKEYYFAGWADSKTGNATYADEQTINIDANGENVLYAVWVEKTEITLVANSGTRTYNGAEQSIEGFESTTMNGYTVSGLTAVTKGTNVGEYINTVFDGTAKVEKDGVDVTDKVVVKTRAGKLVITPKSINPDGPNTPDEKKTGIEVTNPEDSIYDGLPHVNPLTVTDTKTKTDLEENKDYTLTYSSDVINVGTVEVNVKGIGNYTGEFTKTYKITPREYTVTTESAKKVYDGTALTAGGKIEGIVDGEVVVVHTTGSQTEVGSTPNTYKLEWKKASSKNYKLKEDSIGTLTVTEQTIDPGKDPDNPNPNYSGVTINNPSNSVYDGKEHKWSPAVTDKEGNALVEGTDYEVAYSTSDFTNVTGTITVTITGIGNYTGTVTRTYEITPKAYTVTTESAKKVYDGTALTAGGKIEGIVSGETVEFTTTGSRTDEGTSKNTYSLKWNGSAIQTNYKLAKESIGDLTVTPKSIIPDEPDTPDDKKTGITVSNPKDSKYDGQEHREVLTVKDTKTGKDLIANKDYTVVYSDDLVNAGTVKVTVTGLGNYSGSFTKTYKITKRLVTLTSATVSKTYDGQALKNTSITVSGDGFVEGEGASYEVTGTQTSVGNSANAFEYKLNEKTLASNYDITKVVGTLTITAAPAPVTPPTSPTPVSPPPVTPRYIQQVVPALTPQEEVKKEKTPKAEPKEEKVEKVEKEKTPKARPEKFWALINLICAIVTVLFGLLLLISKRHKNKDDEEDETKDQTTTNEDEEKEQEKKRGAFTRVLAVLIAILSVVFFLVTEDLSLRWTWTDQWTIWMVVIGLVQIVVFFVGRKWKNVDDDEDEQAQQA